LLLPKVPTEGRHLLQELGLRDAAVFEAWVHVPAAAQLEQAEESEEDLFPRVTALPSLQRRTYPHETAALTPKDLERAARLHEPKEVVPSGFQGILLPDGNEVGTSFTLIRPVPEGNDNMKGSVPEAPRQYNACRNNVVSGFFAQDAGHLN
jgi:hypothetical protein